MFSFFYEKCISIYSFCGILIANTYFTWNKTWPVKKLMSEFRMCFETIQYNIVEIYVVPSVKNQQLYHLVKILGSNIKKTTNIDTSKF